MSGPYDDGENVLIRFHEKVDSTDLAVKLTLTSDDGSGVWLPKSQVAALDKDAGEAWIPLWLAEKKGLSYE